MCRKIVQCWCVALAVGVTLSACSPAGVSGDGTLFTSSVKASDMALASLAKGDMAAAEGYVTRALHADDRDPYALLAAGMLYQNTSRPAEAIQAYQTIVALNPPEKAVLGQWFTLERRPLAEIASANLEVIRMLPQTASLPQLDARAIAAEPTMTARPAPGAKGGGPTALVAAAAPSVAPKGPPGARRSSAQAVSIQTDDGTQRTVAAAERFRILQRLLDDSLISKEEYTVRRTANLGALLPLSASPPSSSVTLPPPPSDEVAGRLRDLRDTLRRGAITQDQFNAERTAVLDALLPEDPLDRRPVSPVPTTAAGADVATTRLRTLVATGLISQAEAAQEMNVLTQATARAGIPTAAPGGDARTPSQTAGSPPQSGAAGGPVALTKGAPASGALANAGGARAPAGKGVAKSSGGSTGAHLASYRSEAEARQGWRQLQKLYPALLGTAQFQLQPVTIAGKGKFIRLIAGPFDKATAQNLCTSLKQSGQYCVPTAM